MKKILMAAIACVLLSCEKPHTHFIIHNDSGHKIWVQYDYYFYSNLTTVPVYSGGKREIFSTEGIDGGGPANWWDDYKVLIIRINNTVGDTIDFDANNPAYWTKSSSAERNDYTLKITDQSF